jgi:hypothetical protein
LDEICDKCFPIEGTDVTIVPRRPDVVVRHRVTFFPLLGTIGSQMPKEFAVGSAAFEPSKSECVCIFLHLGSWKGICGRASMSRQHMLLRDTSQGAAWTVCYWVEIRLEAVVIGVLIGHKHDGEDDADAAHEHDSASCGTTCESVFVFQPGIVGRHRYKSE